MNEHEKINYIEFPAKNIEAAKDFFTTVFDWSFIDYSPEYSAFANASIDGGFFQSNLSVFTATGSWNPTSNNVWRIKDVFKQVNNLCCIKT